MKTLWPLKIVIIVIILAGIYPASVSAADSRIAELYYNKNSSPGNPAISGPLVVWSESFRGKAYPVYFNLDTGNAGIINSGVNLPNAENIKIDDGLVIYRNSAKNQLWGTNLLERNRFGLKNQESVQFINNAEMSAHYDIIGDTIVFFEGGGSRKDFRFITDGGEVHRSVYSVRTAALKLGSSEESVYAMWADKAEDLYCYKFTSAPYKIDGASVQNRTLLNAWQNSVIYVDTQSKLRLLDLDTEEITSLPEFIHPPVCLHKDNIYYYNSGTGYINLYNLTADTKHKLVQTNSPYKLDSNGSDLVWKTVDGKLFWRASVKKLTAKLQQLTVESGSNTEVRVTAEYKNGFIEEVIEKVTWSSSDETIAIINANRITALKPGTTVLTGEYEGQTVQIRVLVKDLLSIEIAPTNDIVLEIGDTCNLTATGCYTDGTSKDLTTEVSWKCIGKNLISRTGKFTAVEAGTAEITAALEGITATKIITIKEPVILASLKINPSEEIVMEIGDTCKLTTTGFYTDGSNKDLTTEVSWECIGKNLISRTGEFTAVEAGTTEITAALEGITATKIITIKEPVILASLKINPSEEIVMEIGDTCKLTATGFYTDGSNKDLTTEVSWECSGKNLISPTGQFTAAEAGVAEVTAALDGINATKTITIITPVSGSTRKKPLPSVIIPEPPDIIYPALQNSVPDQSIIVVNLDLVDDKLHFILDKKILSLIGLENKMLQITSAINLIIIYPDYIELLTRLLPALTEQTPEFTEDVPTDKQI